MKRLIIILAVLILASPAMAMLGNGILVLENEKGNVSFPHRDHQTEYPCFICHHGQEDVKQRENVPAQKCSLCHDRLTENVPDMLTFEDGVVSP